MRALHPLPSGEPVLVGAKLRTTRQAQGLTIDQVADASGLTKGFLSRVERDVTSPSIATLVAICQVLSLPVGTLFEGIDPEIISVSTAPFINMGGVGAVERLLTPRSESRLQILHSTLAPGSSGGTQLYTINCDVETVHVVRGAVRLLFASSAVTLTEGDTLTFRGSEPHTWENPLELESKILWIIVPAAWSGSS